MKLVGKRESPSLCIYIYIYTHNKYHIQKIHIEICTSYLYLYICIYIFLCAFLCTLSLAADSMCDPTASSGLDVGHSS